MRQALTEAQSWLIICSPAIDAVTLGSALGVKPSAIRNARARFRRVGFSCRVAYVPCHHCGELVTQQGYRAGRSRYHQGCRDEARQVIQRRLDAQRWQRLDATHREAMLDRAHEVEQAWQRDTRSEAIHAHARWSSDELRYLVEHWRRPAHQVARELGRSLYAVRARRSILRARGLAPD